MTKLLVTIGTLSAGGAERVLSILSTAFADNYDQVQYVLWHDKSIHYQIDERVKIVSLSQISGTRSQYKNIKTFRQYVIQENPTLVLSFLTPFNMLVLVALINTKTKVIVCERNDPHNIKGGKLMEYIRNLLYIRADSCLIQTNYGKTSYPSYIQKKMSVIYNPVVMPEEMIGKALRTPKENIFISIGRLHPQKNQKMMIHAMKHFHELYPSYKLVIYGEGDYRGELESFIAKEGLQEIIILPGESKDVWNCMLSAKAFLLSSNYEGMSNALIEAMCLGLPVVSTRVSGSTDLIQNNQNGFLIDVGDENALLEKMLFIANNKEQQEKIGDKASQLYNTLHFDKISRQWIDYMHRVINNI